MATLFFNTSYKNEKYTKTCTETLGPSFSFLEKIKMGGVGSSRFILSEISTTLCSLETTASIKYSNIELRPKGIIVHFTNNLDRYSWVIPYYRLVLYSTQTFSIHANGHFIRFRKNKNYKNNIRFIAKMTALKNTFLDLRYYDY
ncbi:hypothetical protein Q4512_10085 [Oceanihabitans sp. 2_MG-2023]|uniref:hypothetical protein n=1 Tax=Oceanihabitans sp. 2_MG-2023 TaxID=3062661 RepID=UPI0026E3C7D1|nr:hypothetical protein [Oceanihabitans sp. 2_MG-2023]MDO6597262.1 hypothetical protein [Oceanihabitans sp. 2_MG-2023]